MTKIFAKFMIIDTHTHLCDSIFDSDLSLVLERARKVGVEKIISVSETIADAEKNVALAEKFPMIFPAGGLYPTILDLKQADEMISFIKKNREKFIAIGEVGLDFWAVKTEDERQVQREIFRRFILLSNETGLPLNVHSRSAGRHVVEMLIENNARKVQLHAFDGKASSGLPAVEAGYYFSIPPSVVRSQQKRKLVKNLPLSCLLLETDSPVLGPEPRQRNEPRNIRFSIEAIAEIKGISKEEVIETAARNTHALYSF